MEQTLGPDQGTERVAVSLPYVALISLPGRYPATVAISAVIFIVALLTRGASRRDHRERMRRVGLTTQRLRRGRLQGMPASTLLQSRPGIGAPLAVLVVGSLALLERLAGSVVALVTFFLSDWISAPLTVLTARALATLGSERGKAIAADVDTGSSAAAFGSLAAGLVLLPRRFGLPVLGAIFLSLIAALPSDDLAASIAHIYGTLAGAGLGFLWSRRLPRR